MFKRINKVVKNIWMALEKTDMSILPGQLAFFFVLSIVPSITVMSYIASLLNVSIQDLNIYFNLSLNTSLETLLKPSIAFNSFSLSILIILIAGFYISSNGMNSVIIVADNIYGIKYKSFIERKIKSLIMVFFMFLLILFVLLVPVLGNFFLHLFEKVVGHTMTLSFIKYLKMPLSWFVIFLGIKILYTIAPDKEIPSSYVNRGALFSSIGWILATYCYLFYAGHFANYSAYYSGLANIAILMMWMYILAYIFVIGLAINYHIEPHEIEKTQRLEILKMQNTVKNK